MRVVSHTGREDLAVVYLGETSDGRAVEFVEALQPPLPREQKWVVIVSTLFGCPVRCSMCDAGGFYGGKLSRDEILAQIDFLVRKRYPAGSVNVAKFKVQFARMGEPSFNCEVLEVLKELPERFDAPGLLPCLSTVAPTGTERFFDQLAEIKHQLFPERFQLQFSLHTTDESLRDRMIPIKKWNFGQIARYGEKFCVGSRRKIALNFALDQKASIDGGILIDYFDPQLFVIKITPLNPTYRAAQSNHVSYIDPYLPADRCGVIDDLKTRGFDVILSVGEADENYLGSNCGQLVLNHIREKDSLPEAYAQAKPTPQ